MAATAAAPAMIMPAMPFAAMLGNPTPPPPKAREPKRPAEAAYDEDDDDDYGRERSHDASRGERKRRAPSEIEAPPY